MISERIVADDPSIYSGMPIERWKMVMVEHIAALRGEMDDLRQERNAANARAERVAREGEAHRRAQRLQERLDQAVNTISGLQRELMDAKAARVARIEDEESLDLSALKLRVVREALRRSNGVVARAAKLLNLDRSSLYYYMRTVGLCEEMKATA